MSYTLLIPARMASSRLPEKPLADLGGKPMVVRVAERLQGLPARAVVVATDHPRILAACEAHGIQAILTRADHPSGSDRLAEACGLLALPDDEIVVNVQGDEPLIDPGLVQACADLLASHPDCCMSTAAHALDDDAALNNPNVVKVVTDAQDRAMYFSRAAIPWWRDGSQPGRARLSAAMPVLRHIGIYAYRAAFLRRYPELPACPLEQVEALEQLRVLWHGERIAVHRSAHAPEAGVDTPEDLARVQAWFQAHGSLAQGRVAR